MRTKISWRELKHKLEYFAKKYGIKITYVDKKHVDKNVEKSQCLFCDYKFNDDIDGAKNIFMKNFDK